MTRKYGARNTTHGLTVSPASKQVSVSKSNESENEMSNSMWYTVVERVETSYAVDNYSGKRYPVDYSVFSVMLGSANVEDFSAKEHGLEDAEYMANELRDKLNKALPKEDMSQVQTPPDFLAENRQRIKSLEAKVSELGDIILLGVEREKELQADLAAAKEENIALRKAMQRAISDIHGVTENVNPLKRESFRVIATLIREALKDIQSPAPVPSEDRQAEITMHASIMQAMYAESEAPVSPKFKVGDKVRIISNGWGKGDIYPIAKITTSLEDTPLLALDISNRSYLYRTFEDVELVESVQS